MPSVAPFQLWLDCPAITAASRTSNVVTLTTVSAHGLVPGDVIQVADITGGSGSTMNGVYTVATVPTSTTLTYSSTGTNGTGTVFSTRLNEAYKYVAVLSRDVFNPLLNFSATDRASALYVPTETVRMSSVGDGSGNTMSFTVEQDVSPAAGPWFASMPDEMRVRMAFKDTGTAPTSDDLMFVGVVDTFEAKPNGSRLGTSTSITLTDLNSLLDRLVVAGQTAGPVSLESDAASNSVSISRASNVVTVTTEQQHAFSTATSITISNVLGGAGTSFNGSFSIATVPDTQSFTYSQTGSDATGVVRRAVANTATGMVRAGRASNKVQITTSNPHGVVTGQTIELANVYCTSAPAGSLENALNAVFPGSAVTRVSSTQLELTLTRRVADWQGMTTTNKGNFDISGAFILRPDGVLPTATPANGQSQQTIGIPGDVNEDAAAQSLLAIVNRYHSSDKVMQRLINTADNTKISGASKPNSVGVSFPASSLRAALDSVIEAYSGQDGRLRRYWVDVQGRLNYGLVDSLSAPAASTAPYKIIGSGTANPNTSTAQATIYATELRVTYDHHTVKQALVTTSTVGAESEAASKVVMYNASGYAVRPLAPVFDDILDAPTKTSNINSELSRLSKAFLLERHKTILSGSFVLVGNGTQTWNKYGWIGGYRSSGNLVRSWQPSQWVEIDVPSMSLSGLYRVEQVDLEMLPGTYDCTVRVVFNRKPLSNLTSLLNNKGV